MYQCDNCGEFFVFPKYLHENHGMEGPPYEEVPVCPFCGESDLTEAVQCSCCGAYTAQPYVLTNDGNIYCEDCYSIKEPSWI